jgi:hypothetical protein
MVMNSMATELAFVICFIICLIALDWILEVKSTDPKTLPLFQLCLPKPSE